MCRSRGRHSTLLLAKGSDVRPGVGWAPALDVQISWQVQQFVNLHVQISWQYFVNLRVQISWQAQHFAACQGVGCTPWRRLGTGAGCADFVAGTASVELEAENWRLCSTTLVRGVSAGLEDENWRLCSTTLVRGAICGAGS